MAPLLGAGISFNFHCPCIKLMRCTSPPVISAWLFGISAPGVWVTTLCRGLLGIERTRHDQLHRYGMYAIPMLCFIFSFCSFLLFSLPVFRDFAGLLSFEFQLTIFSSFRLGSQKRLMFSLLAFTAFFGRGALLRASVVYWPMILAPDLVAFCRSCWR